MTADTLAIVVTWNKRDMLDRMLASLRASGPHDAYDTLVVDNASTDGTAEMVRAKHPWARLLVNAENLGGTGGFNTGMVAGLRGEYRFLWLMDNDILVHPGALAALRAAMDTDPRIAVVGSHVLYLEEPTRTQEIGGNVDWRRSRFQLLDKFAVDPPPHLNDCDYVAACSLLARASAVRQVGVWDPVFFINLDDVEWGVRMRRAGWRVVATTEACVEHASFFARRPHQGLVKCYFGTTRNLLYLHRRHNPLPQRLGTMFDIIRRALGDAAYFEATGDSGAARAIELGLRDYFRRRFGPCRHTIDFTPRRTERPFPTLRATPRLLLIGSIGAAYTLEQRDALQRAYPDAAIDIVVDAADEEMARAEIPNTIAARFGTTRERLRFLWSVRRRYDATFAAWTVRLHLYEFLARHVVRLGDAHTPIFVARGGLARAAWRGARRAWEAAEAAPLAVVAALGWMPPPDVFYFEREAEGAAPPPPNMRFDAPRGALGWLRTSLNAAVSLVIAVPVALAMGLWNGAARLARAAAGAGRRAA